MCVNSTKVLEGKDKYHVKVNMMEMEEYNRSSREEKEIPHDKLLKGQWRRIWVTFQVKECEKSCIAQRGDQEITLMKLNRE